METNIIKRNVSIIDNCTGCGACIEKCPKHCISLRLNDIDDPVSSVNNNECISCGICLNICHVRRNDFLNEVQESYVGYTENSISNNSKHASGGLAGFIYEKLASQNYLYAVGAIWDKKEVSVKIRCLENKQPDIIGFYNSKYCFSDMSEIYADIKRISQKSEKIVCIAAPCQIAALKGMFPQLYNSNSLFLVDFVCHGMPNNEAFRQYMNKINKRKYTIDEVLFRKNGKYYLKIIQNTKTIYENNYSKDIYYSAFLENIILRECCYHCKYACNQRVGDITIGDYDGKERIDKLDDNISNKSILLVNTKLGKKFIDEFINDPSIHIEKTLFDIASKDNMSLYYPAKPSKYRKDYLRIYKKRKDFYKAAIGLWTKKRIKRIVAIVVYRILKTIKTLIRF